MSELVDFVREHFDGSEEWFEGCRESYPYAMPWAALEFDNHNSVKRALASSGSHFYDPQALRFFNARTSDSYMAGRRFWIESKRFEDDPRQYQVAYVTSYEGRLSVERLASVDSLAKARKIRDRLAALVAAES